MPLYKCSSAYACGQRKCPHFTPHEPGWCVEKWVSCRAAAEECVRCEEVPTVESLADMILIWWEDARYTMVRTGDEEYDNLFDGEPDFVREARKIKEEVK